MLQRVNVLHSSNNNTDLLKLSFSGWKPSWKNISSNWLLLFLLRALQPRLLKAFVINFYTVTSSSSLRLLLFTSYFRCLWKYFITPLYHNNNQWFYCDTVVKGKWQSKYLSKWHLDQREAILFFYICSSIKPNENKINYCFRL